MILGEMPKTSKAKTPKTSTATPVGMEQPVGKPFQISPTEDLSVEAVTLTIGTDEEPSTLNCGELGEFLTLLDNLYKVILNSTVRDYPVILLIEHPPDDSKVFLQSIPHYVNIATVRFSRETHAVAITEISKASPWKIKFKTVSQTAMAVAFFITGGKLTYKDGTLDAEIPSLGHGISDIISAFSDDTKEKDETTKTEPSVGEQIPTRNIVEEVMKKFAERPTKQISLRTTAEEILALKHKKEPEGRRKRKTK